MGAETFRKIALYCKALGVEYLTIYAFSTENWKRPADEVSTLMGLLKKYMQEAIDTMERDQMKLRFFGDLSALSPELQALAHKANEVADRVRASRQTCASTTAGGMRSSTRPGNVPPQGRR